MARCTTGCPGTAGVKLSAFESAHELSIDRVSISPALQLFGMGAGRVVKSAPALLSIARA